VSFLRRKDQVPSSPSADGGLVDPALIPFKQATATGVLSMGEHSYGEPGAIVFPGDSATVAIGKYCSIASGVKFFVGGNHRTDWVTTYPLRILLELPGALADGHPATKGDIAVGNDVWIGADARILSGVTIGDGAVIGTGAIVAADVRPYAIAAGNPAREIRRRFADPLVDGLLRIAWWDWPDAVVRERVDQLCDPDVEGFVRRFDG
jgi:acetyltransferase-like isoleucine patch superfamily enzyme